MGDDLIARSDALALELVPVPRRGADVCGRCGSWRPPDEPLCENCAMAVDGLDAPCTAVVPITLYAKPSAMRDRLTYYKDPRGPEDLAKSDELRTIVRRFFAEHSAELREHLGDWDVATVVPSTVRPPPHPFTNVVQGVRGIDAPVEPLLRRTTLEVGHRIMAQGAYTPIASVRGRRVLVLDDVYTSSAHAQSAASALVAAGAEVAGIVVVGRRINPDYTDEARAVWDRQRAVRYDFEAPLGLSG